MMRTALLVFSLLLSAAALLSHPAETTKALDIGSRLELFVDDYLIDTMAGARLTLHQPVARENRTQSQCSPLGRQHVALSHGFPGRATLPHVLSWQAE